MKASEMTCRRLVAEATERMFTDAVKSFKLQTGDISPADFMEMDAMEGRMTLILMRFAETNNPQ